MTAREGLPPILGPRPRALILGSMPGVASLEARRYYAHPRNAFWLVMAALFGVDAQAPYAARVAALKASGVAVWDVLAACERPGSLDGRIVRGSEVPNPIAALLARRQTIRVVACNGSTAHALFRRHVAPALPARVAERVTLLRLPSTSPAHAAMSVAQRADCWRALTDTMGYGGDRSS